MGAYVCKRNMFIAGLTSEREALKISKKEGRQIKCNVIH
jgi:hypothetical protein